jgi:hypothetical protein
MRFCRCGEKRHNPEVLTPSEGALTELPTDHDASHPKYEVGQVWRYRTRPHEQDSVLVIAKVESYPKIGSVIHICVEGVKIANPDPTGEPIKRIGHMPFGDAALDASVTERAGSRAELPPFADGYLEWRQAFDAGQAGMFIITVAEAVMFLEQTLGQ